MGVLAELQDAISEIAKTVGPSVVGIGRHRGIGSGIVIAPGTVLTNAHNLRSDATAVTPLEGDAVKGAVVAADIDGDLAVVSFDDESIPAVAWDPDGAAVEIGSPVFALSNPGGRGLRVSMGFVTGTDRSFRGPRGRRIAGSIEHTAALLPGSSGGPVVDAQGRLLGINTNRIGEGFYLAIPADASTKSRVDDLSKGNTPKPRRIGVAIVPPEVGRRLRRAVGLSDEDGLLVRGVEEDSPGEQAGIREGDLIVEAEGNPTATIESLDEAVSAAAGELKVKVLRGAEPVSLEIKF